MSVINAACAAAIAAFSNGAELPYDHGYTCVQKGETVSELVKEKTGIDMFSSERYFQVIEDANPHVKNLDSIQPGQVLILPEHTEGLMCAVADQKQATRIDQKICSLAVLLG